MPCDLTRIQRSHRNMGSLISQPDDSPRGIAQCIDSVGAKLHGCWYTFVDNDACNRCYGAGRRSSTTAVAVASDAGDVCARFRQPPLSTVEETLASLAKARSINYKPPGGDAKPHSSRRQ